MRILHICLANFFIDNFNYQENVLVKLNKEDGHDVMVIASTETYVRPGKLGYVTPAEYETEEGVKVKRIPYAKIGPEIVRSKIRKYTGLYKSIEMFNPDVIFCHDICFYSVRDIVKYKRKHPNVRFLADTHTASYNSGKNWLSLHVLHRIFYRNDIKKTIPYLDKYYYIGISEKQFSIEHYRIPESIMEFYPLGGIIPSDIEYEDARKQKRRELGIAEDEFLLVHSGKLVPQKRTDELIKAFSKVRNFKARLVIIGVISDDRIDTIKSFISADKRIIYLGWKTSKELLQYLCAADLYCQPGTPSVTLQSAVCCHCPVMTFPHEIYKVIDCNNFLWVKTEDDMETLFRSIADGILDMQKYKENTNYCARNKLDYRKIAGKIYSDRCGKIQEHV